MKKKFLLLSFLVLISIFNLALADVEQMAIWDFGPDEGYVETVTAEDVSGIPTIAMDGGTKDGNGKNGTSYTDVENVLHSPGQAAAWEDVRVDGKDAELMIYINTTGWENITLRWNYKAWLSGTDSFDLDYSIDDGDNWTVIYNDESITGDETFRAFTTDTDLFSTSGIENVSSVQFRMDGLNEGDGNKKFAFDNLEITGDKIIPNPVHITFADSNFTDAATGLSGVIGDSTDPARYHGINFTVSHDEDNVSTLEIDPVSSNTSVVTNANLVDTGTGAIRNVTITPTGVGYATITVTVTDEDENEASVNISYAASAESNTETSLYHTGMGDASTAMVVDSNYMLVANDEDMGSNMAPIYLYRRDQSGLEVNEFDFTDDLDLIDNKEVDIEASTKVGNRIYWLGSHGNNKEGKCRPDRKRLFATDISGSGENTTLSFVDYYDSLREDLIDLDDDLADYYDLDPYYGFDDGSYCAETGGIKPKRIDGFNIEGLTMSPDGTDAYICFRAPISPANNRTKALVIAIGGGTVDEQRTYYNFQDWFDHCSDVNTKPIFTEVIELDLGGRGIRSIEKNDDDEYLIVAGSYESTTTAPNDFRLYLWSGNWDDTEPVLLLDDMDMNDLISEGGSIESIVQMPESVLGGDVQFLMDNGSSDWYDDEQESKDLTPTFQKFRSDWISIPEKIRLYVSSEGENTTGHSWANAYHYLQDALDEASGNDCPYEIWVANGTYYPDDGDSVTENDISETFQLTTSGIDIYGGFAGTETALSERVFETEIAILGNNGNLTTLSGNIGDDNTHCVLTVTCDSIIDGFEITTPARSGLDCTNASPTIENCWIHKNGRGIECTNSSPTVRNCRISDNGTGSGMSDSNSSPDIVNCHFENNSGDYGGAICNYYGAPTITGCQFLSNSAGDGGGICNSESDATITNCTFTDNTGGAICNINSSPLVTIVGCISWFNPGDDIINLYNSDPTISFSNIEGSNGSGPTWNTDYGIDGGDNIDEDPRLVISSNNQCYLSSLSPCIDAGDNNSITETLDITGQPRIQNQIVDMGAYEFVCSYNVDADEYYSTIQDALDDANDGDEIIVYPGTYYETIDFNGVNCILRSADPNDWVVVEATIIDANGGPNTLVTFDTSEDANAVLNGFNITNNLGTGISCSGTSPTIKNCWVNDNGRGISCSSSSSPTISGCLISENSGGSGVYNSSSSPNIENCYFTDNTCNDDGGAMDNSGGAPTVTNCVFSGNSASGYGGAINNGNSSLTAINCTFANNSDGAMYNINSSPLVTITNCIFWNNPDGQIINGYNSDPNISNTCIEDSNGSGASWDTSLGADDGGNIDTDPCLVDIDSNDLALSSISLCINVGDNNAVTLTVDIDGQARIASVIVDMGAYEFIASHNITQSKYYSTIQGALDDANELDVIEVYPGTFYEHIDFNGVNCTLQSTDVNDWETITDTIIDGGYTSGPPSDTNAVVTFNSSEDANAVLQGLTLLQGFGGGIDCNGTAPTIANCIIKDNIPSGGITISSCSPTVKNCFILDNLNALNNGGGINITSTSSPEIINSVFVGNESDYLGGAISLAASCSASITNCTIYDNTANYDGGGIYDPNSSSTVDNCIIWGNSPDQVDNFTYSGSGVYNYCAIQGGLPGDFNGDPNTIVTATPDFSNTADFDGTDNILGTLDDGLVLDPNYLDPNSPCIDAGNNSVIDLLFDITGNTRKVNDPNTTDTGSGTAPLVDIGAYEFDPNSNWI